MNEDAVTDTSDQPVSTEAVRAVELVGPVIGVPQRPVEVHGVVLIADLVDFSIQLTSVQEKLVRKLWSALEAHPFCKDSPGGVLVNSTGDGLLLAWPSGTNCDRVLELAEHLIEVMRDKRDDHDESSGLRVGIHYGRFAVMDLTRLLRLPTQVIGTAPNECARIVSLGDADDIVITRSSMTISGTPPRERSRIASSRVRPTSPSGLHSSTI